MPPKRMQYQVKAHGWELRALAAAYTVIFIAAVGFVFMIFRDMRLIARYKPAINAPLYAETHTYIVLIESVLLLVIARAAIRFKAYTLRIRNSRDGTALTYIANAMLLSLPYAILFDIASTVKTLFMRTPALGLVTTITNLAPLAVFLCLSTILCIGTMKLKRLLPPGKDERAHWAIVACVGGFLVAIVLYACYFYHMAPSLRDDDGLHHFALSAPALAGVYLLPFAVIWLLGVLSCVNLAHYASRVPGKIYQPMFKNLCCGILISYISTYLVQIFYVSNISSNQFGVGLGIVVALVAFVTVGYGLMYRGAAQLYTLER